MFADVIFVFAFTIVVIAVIAVVVDQAFQYTHPYEVWHGFRCAFLKVWHGIQTICILVIIIPIVIAIECCNTIGSTAVYRLTATGIKGMLGWKQEK